MHSDLIDSAAFGMDEDWFWTAETIYQDGKFIFNLDDEPEIAGIKSSHWATPTLQVNFKDGSEENKPCFIGDVGGQKPEFFSLGCLSQPVQDQRDGKLIGNGAEE